MEKVALMPGIAAYVYTKSGNLSSYGRCNAWGGGRTGGREGEGGVRVRAASHLSPITPLFAGRRSVSIGWEEHRALQAANGGWGQSAARF